MAQRARRAAVFVAETQLKANGTVPGCVNLDTGHIFFRVPVVTCVVGVGEWVHAPAGTAE